MNLQFTAYTNTLKFLDFTSENKYWNDPSTFDELLQSLNNYQDTEVDVIHFQILKHLPSKSKECPLQIFNKIGTVAISLCLGHGQ